MNISPHQKGFTLVELLIVVVILAILAGILVPQFGSATSDAKLSSLDTTLANTRVAIDLFYQNHGFYPGSVKSDGSNCKGSGTTGSGSVDSEAAFLDHLTRYTNSVGEACTVADTSFRYGPYIKKQKLPENPYTLSASTTIVTDGKLAMVVTGTSGGWRFDNITGQFIADHEDYYDR